MTQALAAQCCRVLVVSGRALVAETVAHMVSAGDEFDAVSAAPSSLVDALEQHAPDVVVIDAGDRRQAETAARQVLDRCSGAKVVLLVEDAGVWSERAYRAIGAVGSLSCHLHEQEFLRHLTGIHRGERVRGTARRPSRPPIQQPDELRVSVLTRREREVLVQLGLGERPEDIARSLSISANTVRTHVQNLMLKLAVHSRLEAVAIARKAGLLDGHRSRSIHEEPS